MNWTKATDEQLWNIIENDWCVPSHLIEGLVTEVLNRNIFDHLIKHLINKMFDRWSTERRYNYQDLYQIGYIGIVKAMKNYQVGKGSFKTFAYMNIHSEFLHHIEKVNSDKRKVYDNIVSLNIEKHEDNEESFLNSLVDDTQNPETIVINKMYWNENFKKVTKLEKEIMMYFAEGYSFNEIARIKGYNGAAAITKHFHRGLSKINPQYVKRNLKELGLMTRTKEFNHATKQAI